MTGWFQLCCVMLRSPSLGLQQWKACMCWTNGASVERYDHFTCLIHSMLNWCHCYNGLWHLLSLKLKLHLVFTFKNNVSGIINLFLIGFIIKSRKNGLWENIWIQYLFLLPAAGGLCLCFAVSHKPWGDSVLSAVVKGLVLGCLSVVFLLIYNGCWPLKELSDWCNGMEGKKNNVHHCPPKIWSCRLHNADNIWNRELFLLNLLR